MAKRRLKFEYEFKPEQIAKAFSAIGEEAKDFLEHEIVYSNDPGRRDLAREILGYTQPREVTKVAKNVDE